MKNDGAVWVIFVAFIFVAAVLSQQNYPPLECYYPEQRPQTQDIRVTSDFDILVPELTKHSVLYVFANGDSMVPTIRDGMFCICVPFDNIAVGDVVVYRAYGILINHRIIQIKSYDSGEIGVILKGDNNYVPDLEVSLQDILCRIPQR